MNLNDIKRMFEQCTFGAAKRNPPCKSCGEPAQYVVPPQGIYCDKCLPEDTEIMDFDEYVRKTKTCGCLFCSDGKCYRKATRECETCSDSICDDCYYDSHDYGRCDR